MCTDVQNLIGIMKVPCWVFSQNSSTGLLELFLSQCDLKQPENEVAQAHCVLQYFTVTNNTEAKTKVDPTMLTACFVINLSMNAVH